MSESLITEIAARLRAARAHADLTQVEAGELAGVSWMTIHRLEHGFRSATVDVLYRLARVYGCQPTDFLPAIPPDRPKKGGQ